MKTSTTIITILVIIILAVIGYVAYTTYQSDDPTPTEEVDTTETATDDSSIQANTAPEIEPTDTEEETSDAETSDDASQKETENTSESNDAAAESSNDTTPPTLTLESSTGPTARFSWTQTTASSTEENPLSWRIFQATSPVASKENHILWYRSPLSHSARTVDELEPGTYYFRLCLYKGEYTDEAGTCEQYSNDIKIEVAESQE